MTPRGKLAAVGFITLAVTALIMAPIVYLNGPTDDGIRCSRPASEGTCEVLQAYFPGIGRSSFFVDERDIAGVLAECKGSPITFGHAAPSCRVMLRRKSGAFFPILSYSYSQPWIGAQAAERLNGYFADPSQRSIEVRNDIRGLLAFRLGLAILFALVLVAAIKFRRASL